MTLCQRMENCPNRKPIGVIILVVVVILLLLNKSK